MFCFVLKAFPKWELLFVLLISPIFSYAQVDLPSGRAQVSLPLYNYSDGDNLTTSITLGYTDGAGIKVNKMASSVGLGWELLAGGSISRITRGEPDDQAGGTFAGELYATGNMYTPGYSRTTIPFGMGWMPLSETSMNFFKYNAEVIADRQQDEFAFQVGSRSLRFVIDRQKKAHALDDSKLKIELVEEDMTASKILSRISKFIVTDETGTKYTFSDKETGRIISYQSGGRRRFYLDPPPANLQTYISNMVSKVSDYSVVNGWRLTEILDPYTGKKITFTYGSYDVNYISDIDAVQSIGPAANGGGSEITRMKAESKVMGTMKRLTTIDLPNSVQLILTYATAPRADLEGDNALVKLAATRGGKELLSYRFDYKYFSGTNLRSLDYAFPAVEKPLARLCLTGITRTGANAVSDNPYLFTYYMNSNGMPARLGYNTDHWGYPNTPFYEWNSDLNTYNNLGLIARKESRIVGFQSLIEIGALKTVQYPSGGSLNYEYERNQTKVANTTTFFGGLRVKKIIYKDGVNASPDVIREYSYTKEDGTSSLWGYEEPQYSYDSKLKVYIPSRGNYKIGTLTMDLAKTIVQQSFFNYSQFFTPNFDGANAMGSKVLGVLISSFISFVISEVFLSDPKQVMLTTTCSSSVYARLLNPLPGLYSRVTVYEGDATTNLGKIVYEFTSSKDFRIAFPNDAQIGKPRYINSFYGLLKRKRIYNLQNEVIQEDYNKYESIIKDLDRDINYSTIINITQPLSCTRGDLLAYFNDIYGTVTEYYPLVGRPQLKYGIHRDYTDNSNFNETRTDYEYDDKYNLKKSYSSNSVGEKVEKRVYYPYDYTVSGAIAKLNETNNYSMPVSSETWLISSGKEDMLIGLETANMSIIGNGAIKPGSMYRLLSKAAIPKSVIGDFKPDVLIRNTDLIKLQEQLVYNEGGNISQTVLESKTETNLYDDFNEVIVAKVMNASPADIAFSSFENRAKGNWIIIPSGGGEYISTQQAFAGSNSLDLGAVNKVEKTGLNPSKKYFISYWSQNGTVTVTGGNIQRFTNVDVHNGWILTTIRVTGTSTITITGTGLIDDLRLHPADAVMTTRTYDNLNNISSATDAANVASYYEYDELGRLLYIRDADKNILHAYTYQYK